MEFRFYWECALSHLEAWSRIAPTIYDYYYKIYPWNHGKTVMTPYRFSKIAYRNLIRGKQDPLFSEVDDITEDFQICIEFGTGLDLAFHAAMLYVVAMKMYRDSIEECIV